MNEINREVITLKELFLKIESWLQYLLSKWYFFLITGVLGGGIGFFYAKSSKISYIATTTFVLESGENAGNGLGQMAGLAALAGIDMGSPGGGIFQGDNLFQLYKSRKMIEAALLLPVGGDSTELLIDKYLGLSGAKAKWEKDQPNLLNIHFAKDVPSNLLRARDSILQKVVQTINKENLIVDKLDKKSAIVKVDVKSTDEVFSKEFNEALVKQVNDFYIKTKTKKSLNSIAILQHKTDSVRAAMNGNISVNAAIVDATPNLNPTRQAQRIVPTQRSQFSAETNKAILGQLVQNLEMSKMALMKEAPLIQKIDEPVFPLPIEKLSGIKMAIIGGLLFTFLTLFLLVFKRLYSKIVKR
ncbi:lipopolysaccharide biosynthesis protein [Sphingobacterium detergens]|uniref:lipopolysaccharide biosynthesis protein n=1 Tax=Sphingobacterium detergens TaxID=1145106 RepID=UPI003AAFBFE1